MEAPSGPILAGPGPRAGEQLPEFKITTEPLSRPNGDLKQRGPHFFRSVLGRGGAVWTPTKNKMTSQSLVLREISLCGMGSLWYGAEMRSQWQALASLDKP